MLSFCKTMLVMLTFSLLTSLLCAVNTVSAHINYPRDILASPDGGVVVTGYAVGYLDTVRYSEDGQLQWIHKIDLPEVESGKGSILFPVTEYSIRLHDASDGNIIISWDWMFETYLLNSLGEKLWEMDFDFNELEYYCDEVQAAKVSVFDEEYGLSLLGGCCAGWGCDGPGIIVNYSSSYEYTWSTYNDIDPYIWYDSETFYNAELTNDGYLYTFGGIQWVLRLYDSSGNVIWENSDHEVESNLLYNMAITPDDDIVVFIGFERDLLIRKYAISGDIMWSKLITNDEGRDLSVRKPLVDSNGNIFISYSGYTLAQEKTKLFLMRMDADGNVIWNIRYGPDDPVESWLNDIVLTNNNKIVMAFSSLMSDSIEHRELLCISMDGAEIWSIEFEERMGPVALDTNENGEIFLTFSDKEIDDDYYYRTVKIDEDGHILWQVDYPETMPDDDDADDDSADDDIDDDSDDDSSNDDINDDVNDDADIQADDDDDDDSDACGCS